MLIVSKEKRVLKKKNLILLSSLGAALLVTGCGNHKKNENVATAMQLVEELSYEDALASFDEALLNGEDKELIYRGEGLAYMGLSEYQDAVECFLKAFQYCNGRTGALEYDMNYYLATSYAKLEQYDQAEAVYTSILDMKPKSIDALYLRGCVRLKQNLKDAAVTDFEKAMSLKTDDIDLIVDHRLHPPARFRQRAGAPHPQGNRHHQRGHREGAGAA